MAVRDGVTAATMNGAIAKHSQGKRDLLSSHSWLVAYRCAHRFELFG